MLPGSHHDVIIRWSDNLGRDVPSNAIAADVKQPDLAQRKPTL